MTARRLQALLFLLATHATAEQPAGFNGCHVQGATDPFGRLHLVYANASWNDLYHRVWVNGTWSQPTYLANSSPMWLLFCYPSLAVGTDGIPWVVYGRNTGSYPNDLEVITIARATDAACTSWTYQSIGYDGYRRSMVDVALDENNQPHVVYHMTNKYQPWWYRIVYRRPDGTEVVIRHRDHPQRCSRPRIAYKNGTVHIVWYETTGGSVNVFYASGPPSGPFPVSQVSNVGSGRYVESPGIAVHPNGTPQIVYLVSDWNGSHPVYVGLYLTQPGWTNGVLLENITCSLDEANEDFMPPSICFDAAGNRYVGWAHYTLNRIYCKKNEEPRMEFSPFGHIDLWNYGLNAYYARTGNPGPIYWHQLSGSGVNTPPSITLLSPPAGGAEADQSYTITWTDSDPDNNAVISLFFDTDSFGLDGQPIPGAGGIPEDPDGAGDQFVWNISSLPDDARYWVYATISDGTNPVVTSYSPGSLLVNHVNDPPVLVITSPSGADTAQGSTYRITWTDADPDDDAAIRLYYSSVYTPTESTLIASGISEDSPQNYYDWNLSSVPPGTYRIYGAIFDGELGGSSRSPGTVTVLGQLAFSPTDDASVYRDWEPNLPHGDRPDLDVGADDSGVPDEMAFFKFQVSGLQYPVARAFLRVYCVDTGGGGGAHQVLSTQWSEQTLTWNNMPPLAPTAVSSIPWVEPNNWYSYDVTPLVTGNGTFAIALRSTHPNGAHFASKEWPTPSQRPSLLVLFSGGQPELPPTAIIDSLVPNPVIQGFHPQVAFFGRGFDNDEGGQSIVAWRWVSSLNGQIGTTPTFTLPSSSLAVGTHTITFSAQDDEGVWSSPATTTLEVRPPDSTPPTWPNGTGIQAVADLGTGGSVRLFWNAASDLNGPVTYNVYHSPTSPAFSGTRISAVAWVPGGSYECSFVVSGLPVDVPRYFGVRAQDVVGNEDTNTVEMVCTPTLSPTVFTALPIDDAYVSLAQPDQNFGSSQFLMVGSSEISYLRFVIPSLGQIVSAELRLVASAAVDTATAWPVAPTPWEEETITWNTRPLLQGPALGGIGATGQGQLAILTLTGAITAPDTLCVGLNAPPGMGGGFCSKEHPSTTQRPRLVITYQADLVAPSAPSNLRCTAQGAHLVLTWQPAADNVGVVGYYVYRGTSAFFPLVPRARIASTQALSYTDQGVLGGVNVDHYYAVTAFDAAGNESQPSNRAGEKEFDLDTP